MACSRTFEKKVGPNIGNRIARPSKAVPQQIQASLCREVQPQNGQLSSDIQSVQNGNNSPGYAQNEFDMEDPTEPNPVSRITKNGGGGADPISGASS